MLDCPCKKCGKLFRIYPSQIKKRHYCSPECRKAFRINVTHGQSYTRLYATWVHMKLRCFSPTNVGWRYYGGRGISVCREWAESFVAFREWAMANGYREDLELDRRETNGNYEPSNCRWATRVQQMRNTRKRCDAKTSKYRGVSWCANVGKWRAQIVCPPRKSAHIGLFEVEADAARAYDREAMRLFGEFASLNFKEEGVPS